MCGSRKEWGNDDDRFVTKVVTVIVKKYGISKLKEKTLNGRRGGPISDQRKRGPDSEGGSRAPVTSFWRVISTSVATFSFTVPVLLLMFKQRARKGNRVFLNKNTASFSFRTKFAHSSVEAARKHEPRSGTRRAHSPPAPRHPDRPPPSVLGGRRLPLAPGSPAAPGVWFQAL